MIWGYHYFWKHPYRESSRPALPYLLTLGSSSERSSLGLSKSSLGKPGRWILQLRFRNFSVGSFTVAWYDHPAMAGNFFYRGNIPTWNLCFQNFLKVNPSKSRSFPTKTRVLWVPGSFYCRLFRGYVIPTTYYQEPRLGALRLDGAKMS